jgi:3-oxoacyl-[acyl-carrier-protein] synthase-3
LYHQVRKEGWQGHHLEEGDLVLFASVGAGMHINALVYGV